MFEVLVIPTGVSSAVFFFCYVLGLLTVLIAEAVFLIYSAKIDEEEEDAYCKEYEIDYGGREDYRHGDIEESDYYYEGEYESEIFEELVHEAVFLSLL